MGVGETPPLVLFFFRFTVKIRMMERVGKGVDDDEDDDDEEDAIFARPMEKKNPVKILPNDRLISF